MATELERAHSLGNKLGIRVQITEHTQDADDKLNPEKVREVVGIALDSLGLQEEIDYTLEVDRTWL